MAAKSVGKKKKATKPSSEGAARGRPKQDVFLGPDGLPESREERVRRQNRERQKRKHDTDQSKLRAVGAEREGVVEELRRTRRYLREAEITLDAIVSSLVQGAVIGNIPTERLTDILESATPCVLKADKDEYGLRQLTLSDKFNDYVRQIVAEIGRSPGQEKTFLPEPVGERDIITDEDFQNVRFPKFDGHVPNAGVVDGVRFLSLFSGIGGADLAFMRRGWHALAHAETAKLASVVLKERFPSVSNLGDVAAVDWKAWAEENGPVDVIVGGAPCQSFSQAGKRFGIDDPRGNLSLTFFKIAKEVKAEAFIYENVPFLLKSPEDDPGRDFGLMLAAVREAGYSACWAVLDTRHFGLPQRRRRLYMVGFRGDEWEPAAQVLLRGRGGQWPEAALDAVREVTDDPDNNRPIRFDDVEDAIREGFRKWPNAGLLNRGEVHLRKTLEWRDGFGKAGGLWWSLDTVVDPGLKVSDIGIQGVRAIQKGASPKMLAFRDAMAVALGEKPYIETAEPPVIRSVGQGGCAIEGTSEYMPEVAATLTRSQSLRKGAAADLLVGTEGGKLRQLSVGERERLQGFPTDWTAVRWANGKFAGRTPRNQAIGNAMSVAVLDWIGAGVEDMVLMRKQARAERELFIAVRDASLRKRREEKE